VGPAQPSIFVKKPGFFGWVRKSWSNLILTPPWTFYSVIACGSSTNLWPQISTQEVRSPG